MPINFSGKYFFRGMKRYRYNNLNNNNLRNNGESRLYAIDVSSIQEEDDYFYLRLKKTNQNWYTDEEMDITKPALEKLLTDTKVLVLNENQINQLPLPECNKYPHDEELPVGKSILVDRISTTPVKSVNKVLPKKYKKNKTLKRNIKKTALKKSGSKKTGSKKTGPKKTIQKKTVPKENEVA